VVFGGNHQMEGRYALVLALVALSFVVQEALPDTEFTRLLVTWLQAATLVAAVRAARASHRYVRLTALLAAVSAAVAAVSFLVGGSVSRITIALATALLVGVAPLVLAAGLVRDVRATLTVSLQTLCGVLAIYLLIGMFFSFTYTVIGELSDRPFFAEISDPDRSDYLYFSYTTLTTTGYGDLTAALDIGRTLAVTEALTGQIYLVTIVALIVSNLGPRRRRPEA
jgi:Ion channel